LVSIAIERAITILIAELAKKLNIQHFVTSNDSVLYCSKMVTPKGLKWNQLFAKKLHMYNKKMMNTANYLRNRRDKTKEELVGVRVTIVEHGSERRIYTH